MAHLLGAEALHVEYPTRVVFDRVTLGVDEGDRIGIVGRNGDGKSTLLRILAGAQEPDSGQVTRRGGTTVGVLSQSDDLDPDLPVGVTIVGERAEHEWAGDARIRDVIAGLASDIPWDALVGTLSGGQRRRVALATLLTRDWDVLALDEPTNHLDVEGIAWLAEHLKTRWGRNSGGLLVVTHDRWFLDEVSTTTWEVHDRTVEAFEGGYAAYILQRVERDRQSAVVEQKRQNLARKELAWLRRGPPARTSKPKFRIDAANELIADVPPLRDPVSLRSLATARLGKDVVDLLDAGVAFDEREILRDVTWRIAPGERTGILGANGAGKSTLLSLVAGAIEPTSGRVKRGKTVRIGVLDQGYGALAPVEQDRVREVLARTKTTFSIDGKDVTPAQLLERLGFPREHLSARVADLSGGQRRRLQLLLVLLDEPNVLILDEPTNDLDTDMLAALEDVLDSWPGTLLVVSHDRYFVERVTDQQYAVLDGGLRHLPGGIDEYLRLRRTSLVEPVETSARAAAVSTGSTAGPVLSGAERRQAEKELAAAERRLERLSTQIAAKHDELAAHDQSDYAALARLGEELRVLEAEVSAKEERWLELSEALGG
ncbi:MAG TPA: ABC-F family ATP-binding cassette domain-containing protein [Microbacteriaceae bacterium]|nr:ABC-F family ATP-binding cassette domain-containing protein [Microbacteriaceae bacterium]